MLDALMNIIIFFVVLEGYYRIRRWINEYPYKWTCPRCRMFKASSTDVNVIARVRKIHVCDVV